jgi:hypothetical protein
VLTNLLFKKYDSKIKGSLSFKDASTLYLEHRESGEGY